MYEEKLRVPPGVSLGTDYTSTLALYSRLGIRMLQMTRLVAQFDNPDHNYEIRSFRNVSI